MLFLLEGDDEERIAAMHSLSLSIYLNVHVMIL